MLSSIAGYRMVESVYATFEDGKKGVYVKRSIKERLFSKPFRPFTKTKLMIVTRHTPCIYKIGDMITFHPSLRDKIIRQCERTTG